MITLLVYKGKLKYENLQKIINFHEWPLHVCIYLIMFVLNNNTLEQDVIYV